MDAVNQRSDSEAQIYDFVAIKRGAPGAELRPAAVAGVETGGAVAPSPTGDSVPDSPPHELPAAISEAAGVLIRPGDVGDFLAPSVRALERLDAVQAGWGLVHDFLSIRSSKRRQAVLDYVAEQARLDREF